MFSRIIFINILCLVILIQRNQYLNLSFKEVVEFNNSILKNALSIKNFILLKDPNFVNIKYISFILFSHILLLNIFFVVVLYINRLGLEL